MLFSTPLFAGEITLVTHQKTLVTHQKGQLIFRFTPWDRAERILLGSKRCKLAATKEQKVQLIVPPLVAVAIDVSSPRYSRLKPPRHNASLSIFRVTSLRNHEYSPKKKTWNLRIVSHPSKKGRTFHGFFSSFHLSWNGSVRRYNQQATVFSKEFKEPIPTIATEWPGSIC